MATNLHREPWNKGIIVGQKAPLKLREVWAIRMRLQLAHRARELALFNLGVDSKLRACDLLQLRVRDICHGDRVANRAVVMQQKTHRPVQFEITEPRGRHLQRGSKHQRCIQATGCLLAGRTLRISRPGNTRGSFIAGSSSSESMLPPTELTPSGERKHR
jgi:hypothetical protein